MVNQLEKEMRHMRTEQLEQRQDYLDKLQKTLMDAGGKLLSHRELSTMSVGELLNICVKNSINLTAVFKKPVEVINVPINNQKDLDNFIKNYRKSDTFRG